MIVDLVIILLLFLTAIGLFITSRSAAEKNHANRKREDELIVKINITLDQFVDKLSIQFPQDERVGRLRLRYKKSSLMQSKDHNTYTINKHQIMMCVRDYSKDQQLHDDFNLLIFVAIHELGHVMSESAHHTDEFWANFKFLLRNAAEMGFYNPVDYAFDSKNYCMMQVNDNPYFYQRTPREFAEQLTQFVVQ
jgi:hypothetical protein